VGLNDADDTYFQDMVKEIDADGDGLISFEEFEQMMMMLVDKKTKKSKR